MAVGVLRGQCQGKLFGRPVSPKQPPNHLEHRTVCVQLCQRSACTPALLKSALGGATGVRTGWRSTSPLGDVAMALATDGAEDAVEHGGNVAQFVVLLRHAGHGHVALGLELLVTPGCRLHLGTLRGLQLLHFTFESTPFSQIDLMLSRIVFGQPSGCSGGVPSYLNRALRMSGP